METLGLEIWNRLESVGWIQGVQRSLDRRFILRKQKIFAIMAMFKRNKLNKIKFPIHYVRISVNLGSDEAGCNCTYRCKLQQQVLKQKHIILLIFCRVVRDSTPSFVGPSVGPLVCPSVRPSVRHTLLFLLYFKFFSSHLKSFYVILSHSRSF